MTIQVALLIVSDTASRDPSLDKSTGALKSFLNAVPGSPYTVVETKVVSDEPVDIKREIQSWCEAGIDLILTSGGTGFGVRDSTPEVSL